MTDINIWNGLRMVGYLETAGIYDSGPLAWHPLFPVLQKPELWFAYVHRTHGEEGLRNALKRHAEMNLHDKVGLGVAAKKLIEVGLTHVAKIVAEQIEHAPWLHEIIFCPYVSPMGGFRLVSEPQDSCRWGTKTKKCGCRTSHERINEGKKAQYEDSRKKKKAKSGI